MRLAARARMFVASRTALVTVPRMSVPATAVTLAPPEPPRAPELPFSGESHRSESERSAPKETSRTEDKYVVWSSSPSDSSPHGPGRDD